MTVALMRKRPHDQQVEPDHAAGSLEELPTKTLRELASKYEVEGRSKMDRDELIAALAGLA